MRKPTLKDWVKDIKLVDILMIGILLIVFVVCCKEYFGIL